MAVHGGLLRLETAGDGEVVDLTEGVRAIVRTGGVERGAVIVFARGSTVAITTMEYEPGGDRRPRRRCWSGSRRARATTSTTAATHDTNAHAHLRAALIGPSETVPIVDGELVLGTWQQLVLIDFDDRPRRREVVVQVLS